jgi:DnaK suppressor protein
MPNDDFAEVLADERRRVTHQIVELQKSFDDIVEAGDYAALDDEHDPDGSTVAFERAQVAALLDQAQRRRSELMLMTQRSQRSARDRRLVRR